MKKVLLASVAVLTIGANALAGSNTCEGVIKVEGEWATITGDLGDHPEGCRFKSASPTGRHILAICPDGSDCIVDLPLAQRSNIITRFTSVHQTKKQEAHSITNAEAGRAGLNVDMNKYICMGHLWIQKMASIQSKDDSQSDPLACWFDPTSKVGKRVLRVCDQWGGTAKHDCWVKGTFRTDGEGNRELTGVVDVAKIDAAGRPRL